MPDQRNRHDLLTALHSLSTLLPTRILAALTDYIAAWIHENAYLATPLSDKTQKPLNPDDDDCR